MFFKKIVGKFCIFIVMLCICLQYSIEFKDSIAKDLAYQVESEEWGKPENVILSNFDTKEDIAKVFALYNK